MMKNRVIKPLLLRVALFVTFFAQFQAYSQGSLLLAEYPSVYIVKDSDTLWDIAGQFLQDPLRWSEIFGFVSVVVVVVRAMMVLQGGVAWDRPACCVFV